MAGMATTRCRAEPGTTSLDGGPDGSTLVGGIGNDIYDVRSAGDIVVENAE